MSKRKGQRGFVFEVSAACMAMAQADRCGRGPPTSPPRLLSIYAMHACEAGAPPRRRLRSGAEAATNR
jgi:hypothetical protein